MPEFSGHALRAHRKAAGKHIGHLADDVGRSPWTIAEYELGRCQPPVRVVGQLAAALRVPVCALFTDEEGAAGAHGSSL